MIFSRRDKLRRSGLSSSGHTLIELLVGLIVMGALAAGVVAVAPGMNESAERTRAVAAAKTVDAARALYALDATSVDAWNAAASDDKVSLLIAGGYLSGALSDYTRFRHGVTLGIPNGSSIRGRTEVYKNGVRISP